jgi:hypothetical protein
MIITMQVVKLAPADFFPGESKTKTCVRARTYVRTYLYIYTDVKSFSGEKEKRLMLQQSER